MVQRGDERGDVGTIRSGSRGIEEGHALVAPPEPVGGDLSDARSLAVRPRPSPGVPPAGPVPLVADLRDLVGQPPEVVCDLREQGAHLTRDGVLVDGLDGDLPALLGLADLRDHPAPPDVSVRVHDALRLVDRERRESARIGVDAHGGVDEPVPLPNPIPRRVLEDEVATRPAARRRAQHRHGGVERVEVGAPHVDLDRVRRAPAEHRDGPPVERRVRHGPPPARELVDERVVDVSVPPVEVGGQRGRRSARLDAHPCGLGQHP